MPKTIEEPGTKGTIGAGLSGVDAAGIQTADERHARDLHRSEHIVAAASDRQPGGADGAEPAAGSPR